MTLQQQHQNLRFPRKQSGEYLQQKNVKHNVNHCVLRYIVQNKKAERAS